MKADIIIAAICLIGAIFFVAVIGAKAQYGSADVLIAPAEQPPLQLKPYFECTRVRVPLPGEMVSYACCCEYVRPRYDGAGITDDRQPVSCFAGSCR